MFAVYMIYASLYARFSLACVASFFSLASCALHKSLSSLLAWNPALLNSLSLRTELKSVVQISFRPFLSQQRFVSLSILVKLFSK